MKCPNCGRTGESDSMIQIQAKDEGEYKRVPLFPKNRQFNNEYGQCFYCDRIQRERENKNVYR